MALKSNMFVRHGTLEDRSEVLEIDAYCGQDYLSAVYEKYCEDPWRIHYLLVVDGKIVSYFAATVVDDGEGVIFIAARTHQDHRRLGYLTILKEEAARELKTIYPNMKEVLFTAGSLTPNDTLFYRVDGTRRIIMAMPFMYVHICTHKATEAAREAVNKSLDNIKAVQEFKFDEITRFLATTDFKALFPEGRVIIDWIPYRIDCKQNFSLTRRFPDTFQVSRDQEGRIEAVSFRTVLIDEDRSYERYNLEIFANSRDATIRHAAFHLNEILERKQQNNVYISFLFSLGIDGPDLKANIKETFGIDGSWPVDVHYIPLVCDLSYFV